jgi:molecular chaperone HtpG
MDWEHRDKLAALVRYESSHGEGLTSLADYVSRMPEAQKAIYYVVGDSKKAVADSPHIEAVRRRGYEVLYMTDVIDTWAAEGLREYQGKKLVSVQNADLSLDETPEEKKEKEGLVEGLAGLFGRVRAVLGERIKEVRASDRLTDSPACLVVPPGGVNAQIERVLRAHGREVPPTRRILEVNPGHPLIQRLNARLAADADDAQVGEYIELLYDQALMTEGTAPDDPQRFARRLTALMQQSLGD